MDDEVWFFGPGWAEGSGESDLVDLGFASLAVVPC